MHVLRRRRRPDPALILLRTLCHELRSPVTTLTSLVGALEGNPSTAQRDQLARLAAEQAAHADAVLSQAAAAAHGLGESPDPAQPLHRVLPSAVAGVPPGRLDLCVTGAAQDWPVHPRHTRQVLINLVSNAVRHGSPDNPIGVRAFVRRGRLRLCVTSGGPAGQDLHRALSRTTAPPGDKGLGLWVVRQLVAGLGGSMRVRRLRPDAVTVEVQLPRRR
jgi:signal transduction histidine kinase